MSATFAPHPLCWRETVLKKINLLLYRTFKQIYKKRRQKNCNHQIYRHDRNGCIYKSRWGESFDNIK